MTVNSLATLSFRGTSSSQTLILLDGVPLYDPQLGQIDLSLLPTSLIEEAQVLHGQGSSLYGSQSLGGVVHLTSLQNSAPFFFRASGLTGPYGERIGKLTAGLSKKRIRALVSASHNVEQGNFPYVNPSLFPPQTSKREGADRMLTSVFGKASYHGTRSSTTFSAWFNDAARGLPGTATTTPKGERQWDQNSRLQASHVSSLPFGLVTINGALQRRSLRYINPQLNLDQTGRPLASTLEIDLSTSKQPVALSAGLVGNFYRARHPNLDNNAHEIQVGGYIHGAISNKRSGFFPALRIDTFSPSSGNGLVALSPSAGFNFHPFLSVPLKLKTSIGRAFRAPTFNDRFWQPGGNPDLKAEHGWHYDAGIILYTTRTPVSSSIELTGFQNRINNQITWLPGYLDNPDTWAPINIGITRTTGVEATSTTSLIISSQIEVSANLDYTLTDSRDITSPEASSYNQPLRYVPRHLFKSRLGITAQSNHFRWHLDAALRYTGRRYITTDGSQHLSQFTTADLSARITRRVGGAEYTAGLFLENAANASYEVIKGYPVPPRSLRIQLALQLTGTD